MSSSNSAASPKRTVRESAALLRSFQKPPRGVSVYTLHVNRPWGRVLASVADVAGLTPNGVTVLSGISSMTAIVLLATRPASVGLGIGVAFLLMLGFALDSADGQLARLRGSGSQAGEFLDHMLDCLVKLTLHAAVLIAWWSAGIGSRWLLVPLGFQVAAVLLFFGGTLVGVMHARPASEVASARRVRSWLLLPVDHGLLCLVFVLWGFPAAFAAVYTLLFLAYLLVLGALGRQWFRELS